LNAGTVDTGSTGDKEITISQLLPRGYYFLAIRCTGSPTLKCLDASKPIKPPVAGYDTTMGFEVGELIMTVIAAYADPAPAPTANDPISYATIMLREN
ncbi:unnamed protein product, partial [marine sediment metagenome]